MGTGPVGEGGVAILQPDRKEDPMTDDRLPLAELAAKSGDSDFLRTIAESVLQLIIESGGAKLDHGSGGIVPLRAA